MSTINYFRINLFYESNNIPLALGTDHYYYRFDGVKSQIYDKSMLLK